MVDTEIERVVVKYGTNSVADNSGMDASRVDRYAEDIARLSDRYNFIVVTSGAVAAGKALWLEHHSATDPEPSKQTLATLGSADCFSVWKDAFKKQRKLAGSIQVTHREIDDESEGDNLRDVLAYNLQAGVISIINENDALSDAEIAALSYGGDNDGLATHIAIKIWARHICFLTGVEGLLNPNGQIVETVVPKGYETARKYAGREGTNSMRSKVDASIEAAEHGIDAHISHANLGVHEVIEGNYGTHFPRQQC